MSLLHDFQMRIVRFVIRTWGEPVLNDMKERTARVVEEAVELGQAGGLTEAQVEKIVRRVYTRPVGEQGSEAAGVGLTLLAWCHAAGVELDFLLDMELDRIEGMPTDHFRAKHAAKVAAGTSAIDSIAAHNGCESAAEGCDK